MQTGPRLAAYGTEAESMNDLQMVGIRWSMAIQRWLTRMRYRKRRRDKEVRLIMRVTGKRMRWWI